MMSERKRVYVWEFPVRLTHWLFVLSIVAFAITGIYIGNPYLYAYTTKEYIMGWMRFIHFVSAYVFLISFIIRMYWSLMGNKYACVCSWFPFTAEKMGSFVAELKYYLLISRKPSYAVGHTVLAGFTYLIVFLLFIFEICSGFALYSVYHTGTVWFVLGGWMRGFMYLPVIRLYHHLVMYVLIAFAIFHVYVVISSDSKEKSGLLLSIFNGYKFVTGKE
ncbi:MAG: Ni/Fe-hydrogenase, b-type cytochrome subunit [Thermodesulfovibrionia bacterium]|nr:Ni/Fe-hydrogenase, b-type cytochrome subunit [Thermodesulfovibrionia bacterium]